ncbi:Clan CA, family C54, ATG4-like cysteine peptidase [Trichomonas vaginalis G3]|uniref:Cysteine protease n=1 Tax=Trichomonas vaginalis (strain ATCC PRA-98 / G3) TaxID=412133 RepID=A2E9B4_TRIV3|nr:protein delipidation [Trichomonas vaginalis G3]EAY10799.1 Clan CA, family C54, ATG4-like cysteine peptidase [Trichomonas vaginalis G3]KAI5536061.1 protein delipidation [Trichomonas vaginalis G3]|eukprot:XP_001323022.1 Clan CA, family C54, ATG4-like cysteine peptidase [Trichomonas vaginalis G3]
MKVINSDDTNVDANQILAEIPRFCYRNNFQAIENSTLSCDSGWGCCFRSSQGLVCQYILRLHKNFPDLYNSTFGIDKNPLDLFLDIPEAPFGIQNIVTHANSLGLPIGNWAKPSIIASAYKSIFQSLHLNCIVPQDSTFIYEELESTNYPVLILIPGLFGLEKIEKPYISFIFLSLCMNSSLGFVSGHNDSAFYFIGFDSDYFYYFDPHVTKQALTGPPYDSLFELKLKSMKIENINPSVLLGFYCDDSIQELIMQLMGCIQSPIAVIEKSKLDDILQDVIEFE